MQSPSPDQAAVDPPSTGSRRRRAQSRRSVSEDTLLSKLATKNTDFAKKLHDTAYIYALYGALDGLSLSYSTFKYLFDLLYTNSSLSSTDVMHEWMITPAGIAAAAAESITIIAFSLLANIYDNKKDQKQFERFIAAAWPYGRDIMKGLKNAYKGVRSMLLTTEMLGGQNLHKMIVPAGVVLGVISIVERLCMRKYVVEPRKVMMKNNSSLLASIQNIKFYDEQTGGTSEYNSSVDNFDASTCQLFRKGYEYHVSADDQLKEKNKLYFKLLEDGLEYSVVDPTGAIVTDKIDKKTLQGMGCKLKAPLNIEQLKPHMADILKITSERKHTYFTLGIQSQTNGLRHVALWGEAYRGVVDGLYLYMGAMSITALAPPVFLTMAIFSVIFTVTCIATRIYEEWDYQRQLVETQAQIEMALCEKEIEAIFGKMQLLSRKQAAGGSNALTPREYDDRQRTSTELLVAKLADFDRCKKYLRSQVLLSYTSAALAGLRNGLYAYSAISSLMFAVAMITAIASLSFPPFLVLAFGIAGMSCLIGFLAHSLITNYQHLKANPLEVNTARVKIDAILDEIKKNVRQVSGLKPSEIEGAILDDNFDQSPQFWFQEWFEVLRSFFSGVGKGQKSIDYTFNPLLEPDDKGHYQDSPIMLWFTLATATIYTVVLTLRAHARGFGRPKITDTGADTPVPSPSPVVESPAAGASPTLTADAPFPGGTQDTTIPRPQPVRESSVAGAQPLPVASTSSSCTLNTTQDVPSAFKPVGRDRAESEKEDAPLLGEGALPDLSGGSLVEDTDKVSPLRGPEAAGVGTMAHDTSTRAMLEVEKVNKAPTCTEGVLRRLSIFNTGSSLRGNGAIPRPASSGAFPPPARGSLMRAASAVQLPSERDPSPSHDGIVAGSR